MILDPEEPVTEESLAAFSVKFNVRGGSQSYGEFIKTLRRQVGENFFLNLPVLPDQNLTNRRFHVVLEDNDNEIIQITLSFRLENLYLVGFKTKDSPLWLEFGKHPSPHQILGSTFLGFDVNYKDLERAAHVNSRNEIFLGEWSFIGASYNLAANFRKCKYMSDKTRAQTRAHALIIMTRMICESMRFVKILDHIVKNFSSGFYPENWMVELEVCWGRNSRGLLSYDDEQIDTTILGVLLFKFRDVWVATVEVILKKGGGNIHGHIFATRNGKHQTLFEKSIEDDIEHVTHGESMRLSTSVIAIPLISSVTTLIVDAQLFHKNSGISEHEIAKGSVEIAKGSVEFPCKDSGTVQQMISGEEGKIQVKVTWKRVEKRRSSKREEKIQQERREDPARKIQQEKREDPARKIQQERREDPARILRSK